MEKEEKVHADAIAALEAVNDKRECKQCAEGDKEHACKVLPKMDDDEIMAKAKISAGLQFNTLLEDSYKVFIAAAKLNDKLDKEADEEFEALKRKEKNEAHGHDEPEPVADKFTKVQDDVKDV